MDSIEVLFISNRGKGYAVPIPVPQGESLKTFVNRQSGIGSEDKSQILVNGQAEQDGYVLEDGDRITVTPIDIKGGS